MVACFVLMIGTRICNVFMPYYSKLIIDQLSDNLLTPKVYHEVAATVGMLVFFQLITGNNGIFQQIKGILYITCEQEIG